MGFIGLENMYQSDKAADAYGEVLGAMLQTLEEELQDKSNKYNTSGCVNVALLIESELFQGVPKEDRDIFEDVIKKSEGELALRIDLLGTLVHSNDCTDEIKYQYKSYKRMLKSLQKWRKIK